MSRFQSLAKVSYMIWCVWLLASFTSEATAYVNGGDFRNDFASQKQDLEKGGWRAVLAVPLKPNREPGRHSLGFATRLGATTISDPDVEPEFSRSVKQLVARAIAELPKDDAARFTPQLRDQLVVIALERLKAVSLQKPLKPETHDIGPFECKVGSIAVSSWWETNYGKEGRKTHAYQTSTLCYIAIKTKEIKAEEVKPEVK